MTGKERLKKVMEWAKAPKESAFAKELGVSRNGIVKALTREVTFSENLADLIVTRYPEIRKDWLLNENGDMLNSIDDTIRVSHNVDFSQKKKYRSWKTKL